MKKASGSRALRQLEKKTLGWEFWLLMILMVTVLGIFVAAPVSPLPLLSARGDGHHRNHDPYGIYPDVPGREHNRHLETGL